MTQAEPEEHPDIATEDLRLPAPSDPYIWADQFKGRHEGPCDHCDTNAKIFIELRNIQNEAEELRRLCVRHYLLYYDPKHRNLDLLASAIDWRSVFRENARLTAKYWKGDDPPIEEREYGIQYNLFPEDLRSPKP